MGPLRTQGVGVCLHSTECGTGICNVTTEGSASENWWIPEKKPSFFHSCKQEFRFENFKGLRVLFRNGKKR